MNIEILVFASNINNEEKVNIVCARLLEIEGVLDATIDLEDRENILRVEVISGLLKYEIENEIFKFGFKCTELY